MYRGNTPLRKEVIDIPTTRGKNKSLVMYPEEEKIIRTYADQIYRQTGKFSESEAVRRLIVAGAKALKVKVDDHLHG